MIKFFYANTPNVIKVLILFKELNLKYSLIPINVMKGVNKYKAFSDLFPYAKVPAVIDGDFKLYESSAILLHYGNQYSKFVFQNNPKLNAEMMASMFWLESDLLASLSTKFIIAKDLPHNTSTDLLKIIDERVEKNLYIVNLKLEGNHYLISNTYSVADIEAFSLINAMHKRAPLDGNKYPNIIRWLNVINQREAVISAFEEANQFNWEVALSEDELIELIKA